MTEYQLFHYLIVYQPGFYLLLKTTICLTLTIYPPHFCHSFVLPANTSEVLGVLPGGAVDLPGVLGRDGGRNPSKGGLEL